MRLPLLLLLCLAAIVINKVDSSFINSTWSNAPQPCCDLTELTYDIALLLDVSMRANAYGASVWADFTSALSRALSAYYPPGGTFSQTGTQLAIISVAGNAMGSTKLINTFADSNGKRIADLLVNINQQMDFGQSLPSAINILRQLATNSTSGYRNPAQYPNVRHLAIYATLNGAQTEGGDPVEEVQSLIKSGIFGFSVVASNNTYYDAGYKYNLESLTSSPCLYFAIDNPINTYIPYYINGLTRM